MYPIACDEFGLRPGAGLYIGAPVDLAVPGTSTPFESIGGYALLVAAFRWLVVEQAGSFTGAPIVSLGNNLARNNFVMNASSPSLSLLAAGAATPWPGAAIGGAQAGATLIDLSTPIGVNVVVPATGAGIVLRARPVFIGAPIFLEALL